MAAEETSLSLFESVSFSGETIGALIAVCVLLAALPIGMLIYWRRKHKAETSFKWLIVGALGFLVSARVLELGVHYFCILSDNAVSRFITGSNVAYVIYGIVMAGVFEECGRYLIMRFLLKKGRTRENAVFYGIGHGGIEVLLVMLPVYIGYLVIAFAFTKKSIPEALALLNVTEETAAVAYPSILAVSGTKVADLAAPVIERILTMGVHTGLSVVVYHGVCTNRARYLGYAILLHMAVDLLPAMYQRGLVSLWLCEGWLAVWTFLIVLFARKLYLADKDGSAAPVPSAG